MAAFVADPKQQPSTGNHAQQQQPLQPPAYHVTPGQTMSFGGPGSDPGCFQHGNFNVPLMQPSQGPTVMVTQPVTVSRDSGAPDTTCALVMSTLSAIFCGLVCGSAGILLAWKARLQVLDKKFEHARHSIRIVWVFFGIAILFGAALWIPVGILLYLFTNPYRYY
ncbi:hypothetical protein ACOMHN_000987 [Nucella lapillus]